MSNKEIIVYGLRSATPEYIAELAVKHPLGVHITHKLTGEKLPYNGVFYSKLSERVRSWAKVV